VTVRRVAFEYPADVNVRWSPRRPEFAASANSVSLLMPYMEPYVVASVRSALPDLDDDLRERTEHYLRQELQHHRQHRRFNDELVSAYPGLRRVESWMQRSYRWLARTRSRPFSVAYAAGFEAVAFNAARWVDRRADELFADADPLPTTLLLWHLAEEVEHKSVAFDVYEAIGGTRRTYAVASIVAMVMLAWFSLLGTLTMLAADRRLLSPVTHWRMTRWTFSFTFDLLPAILVSALPGHHPSRLRDPAWMSAWLRQFDPDTGTLPEWQPETAWR